MLIPWLVLAAAPVLPQASFPLAKAPFELELKPSERKALDAAMVSKLFGALGKRPLATELSEQWKDPASMKRQLSEEGDDGRTVRFRPVSRFEVGGCTQWLALWDETGNDSAAVTAVVFTSRGDGKVIDVAEVAVAVFASDGAREAAVSLQPDGTWVARTSAPKGKRELRLAADCRFKLPG